MEKIKTKEWNEITIRENEEKWLFYSTKNWEPVSHEFAKDHFEKEQAIRAFDSIIEKANPEFALEQKVYVWMYVKEMFVNNKPIVLLEYTSNWATKNDVLVFDTINTNDSYAHYYECDFSHIQNHIQEIKWSFLSNIWCKRVKNWFLIIFYITIWYWKENVYKEIKVFTPAYSEVDTYYSDDVSLIINKWTETIIESIAKNAWCSYSFNERLGEH